MASQRAVRWAGHRAVKITATETGRCRPGEQERSCTEAHKKHQKKLWVGIGTLLRQHTKTACCPWGAIVGLLGNQEDRNYGESGKFNPFPPTFVDGQLVAKSG